MKLLFLLYLFLISLNGFASNQIKELNAENLMLLALKNSPDALLNDYAYHLLKTQKVKEYYRYKHNKHKIEELIAIERKHLDELLEKITKTQKFSLSDTLQYKTYDNKKSLMNLGNIFKGNLKTIGRANNSFSALPNYFHILIPNIEQQYAIKINSKRFKRRQNYYKKLNQKENKTVYVQYVLSLEKFQNNQDFQAVIEKIDIYTSSQKKTILGTIIERRQHTELIDNWLLSSGYTNPLNVIGAFKFAHKRLQDSLVSASNLKNICKKTKRIGSHDVVVCKQPFSLNSSIIINYLGGKVAQIDFVANRNLTSAEIKRIKGAIKKYLDLPTLKTDYSITQWTELNVDFILYSDAFMQRNTKVSKYTSVYDTLDEADSHRLIFTMIGKDTKKLLFDLGVKL